MHNEIKQAKPIIKQAKPSETNCCLSWRGGLHLRNLIFFISRPWKSGRVPFWSSTYHDHGILDGEFHFDYVLLTFEILKHEYLRCEKYNLVFMYKIHYKNMSSDWAKNLGMCLWRYYIPLIISRFQIFRENVQKNLQIFKNQSSDVSK